MFKNINAKMVISERWLGVLLGIAIVPLMISVPIIGTHKTADLIAQQPTWLIAYRAMLGAVLCVVPTAMPCVFRTDCRQKSVRFGTGLLITAPAIGLAPYGLILCGVPIHAPNTVVVASSLLGVSVILISMLVVAGESINDALRRVTRKMC